MELIQAYQRKTKIDRLHYIAMESIINWVFKKHRGKSKTEYTMITLVEDLKNEMLYRNLDRYFQVEVTFKNNTTGVKVHEINVYNQPKECVIWNL